jgi:hypothetical protein
LGKSTIHLLIINTIAPFLFLYGQQRGDEKYKEMGLRLLEEMASEKNAVIGRWNSMDILSKNAFDSQALLQLYNEYCSRKRCLECAVGNKLIRGKA